MPASWVSIVILIIKEFTIYLLIRKGRIREAKNRREIAQLVREKPLYTSFICISWYQYPPLVPSSTRDAYNSKTKTRPEDSSNCISLSSTYRAMNNVDILLVIVDCLYPNLFAPGSSKEEVRERQRALARLACTCKSFKDIALAILWRDQDGLDRILKLVRSMDGRTVRGSSIPPSLTLILILLPISLG